MPIRRMNYTKRINLKREHVGVRLADYNPSGAPSFEIELNLPKTLPDDARIALEAYRGSPPARMRFELGTVANPAILTPEDRQLTEFHDDLPPPLFRLKIVGVGEQQGRLLADARQIRLINEEAKKQGILHIHHKDLEGPVWMLDFENTGYQPTLWIDDQADPDRALPHDRRFIALVFPEVLRSVLTHLLLTGEEESVEDEDDWGHAWVQLATSLPQMVGDECPPKEDQQERQEWIARAVKDFARSSVRARDLMAASMEGAH